MQLVPRVIVLLSVFLTVVPGAADSVRRGADLLAADILCVLAHPDDETGMAPALAYYARGEGRRIVNAYLTRGEGGGNMVGRQWGPSLGLLREAELRQCLTELGVERVYFLGQRDWAYTESAQMTLAAWDRDSALEQLVRLIRATRPKIVLTMNPTPRPGQHGHHQAAGILAIESFQRAGDPAAFPAQIRDEGLVPWTPLKLYITGPSAPFGATIESTAELADGRTSAQVAGSALSNHRSQGFGRVAGSPWLARPRSFRLLLSAVGFEPEEKDLFRRIDLETLPRSATASPPDNSAGTPNPGGFRFRSNSAVERFRRWASDERVPDLAHDLPATLSVSAGDRVTVELLTGSLPVPARATLEVTNGKGWETIVSPIAEPREFIPIQVQVPDDATEPTTLTAAARTDQGRRFTAELALHPVPVSGVPGRVQSGQTGSFKDTDWDEAARLEISHRQTWSGSNSGASDCSAVVQVTHDRRFLRVRVRVQDDVVVGNIAPDDIRGHWRTDSVEICVDPDSNAEHTLRTFKVGIIPFDTSDTARAARDADARQGPIERTAPDMRIASRKTDSGYEVIAAIPWSDIGGEPTRGRRLGFNVLIYDGDRSDAAPGENINECRLAWSPRSGVQGRPQDWGRITIE